MAIYYCQELREGNTANSNREIPQYNDTLDIILGIATQLYQQ